ncbi:MAG: 2-dehydropantoate 2-reductase [Chloroflexi bacterium]|nr:2-dehydropantoate 2-reductase [Chloroflexota bacterium]
MKYVRQSPSGLEPELRLTAANGLVRSSGSYRKIAATHRPSGTMVVAGIGVEEEAMTDTAIVVGAGAIGGVFGARIARAGRPIVFVDAWTPHLEKIKAEGIFVDGAQGESRHQVPTYGLDELDQLPRPVKNVFLAVKSYDTQSVVERLKPLLSDNGAIVSLQNGINEELIAEIVGSNRTLGAVTRLSAGLIGPGHVRESRAPTPFSLGELSGEVTERAQRLAELMHPAAPTEVTPNIWGTLWGKLVWNSMMNPTCGITGLTSGGVWRNPRSRDVLMRICQESMSVAKALGIQIDADAKMDVRLLVDPSPEAQVKGEAMIDYYATHSMDARPSMLQDVLRGRPSEIDFLSGYIAKKGAGIGIATPINSRMVELVKEIESGQRKIGEENLEALT